MKLVLAVLHVGVVVAVLMGLQWLSWYGPDWIMWEMPQGETSLGPGTLASAALIIVAAVVSLLTRIHP